MVEVDIYVVVGFFKFYFRDFFELLFIDDFYFKFVEVNGRLVCFGFVFFVMIVLVENSIYRFCRLEKCCIVYEL